jgi:hypothetical protein
MTKRSLERPSMKPEAGGHSKERRDDDEVPSTSDVDTAASLLGLVHGDFRYDSLENLPTDLATQTEHLSQCMINAGTRFGFVVAGYGGRDDSVMRLFRAVLDAHNPFPHGLFWTGMKGAPVPPAVEQLLATAWAKGVNAQPVAIETFDAVLLRLWRNIERKPSEIDAHVRKSQAVSVDIPLPPAGAARPLLRLNARRSSICCASVSRCHSGRRKSGTIWAAPKRKPGII